MFLRIYDALLPEQVEHQHNADAKVSVAAKCFCGLPTHAPASYVGSMSSSDWPGVFLINKNLYAWSTPVVIVEITV
jgi:hypothetical protein